MNDAELPEPPPSTELSTREKRAARMIPYIVGCALFMQMLDSTVVATALPQMASSLGTNVINMNMIITSYLLAVAVFVPISGWAADRFGARRIFLAAILLFTASSVACAASQTLLQLTLARVVQGMAGAMMVPVGRIILLRRVPKDQLLQAMAVLTLPALMGPIIGPPVGGVLVTYASWHWIFLINLPVGLLGIWLVLRYIRSDYPLDPTPLDWRGFLLSAVALATLVTAFENMGHGTFDWRTLAAMVTVGVVSGLWYIWHAKRTPYPILDLSLLRTRTFAISVLGGNLCRFSLGAAPFLLAILLQVNFGMSALNAGLITFTGAIGALLMKLVAPPIIRRFGYRKVLFYNAFFTGLFIALCALFQAQTPIWIMISVLTLGGFFRSLQFTAINTLTYADLDEKAMSRASSFASMAQQLAISLGVACAAVTLHISMSLRQAHELSSVDVMWGFIVLGVITSASALSFMRLQANDGQGLQ